MVERELTQHEKLLLLVSILRRDDSVHDLYTENGKLVVRLRDYKSDIKITVE